MKKANENEHPTYCVLRDWSKNIHINNTVAEKTERIPSLSILPEKINVKCTRQVYILPH